MSALRDFNILGKIDGTKTVVTPHEFIFKLKEVNAITGVDYEKLKNVLNDQTVITPSKEWLEQEKDKHFQNLFKQLWPSIYSSINPPEPKPVSDLIAELEKKRVLAELIAKQDLERYKASLVNNNPLPSTYSNVYTSKFNDTLNICINGLNSSSPKIEIKSNAPPEPPKPEPSRYPMLGSSYDYHFKNSKYLDTIVNSPYNPSDLAKETELLKSIQESQEKLRLTHKLEKTTDLVDDIIDKVKLLQTEMKKKSVAMKLENDLDQLRKDREQITKSTEMIALLESELERKRYSRLSDHNHHHHHHHSKDWSDDSDYEIKNKYPTSILKNHKPRVSHALPSISSETKRYRSKSAERLNRSKSFVSSKVDCWNCNCKHDTNIY